MSEHLFVMVILVSTGSCVYLLFFIAKLLSARSQNVDHRINDRKTTDAFLRLDGIIKGAVNTTNQKIVNYLKDTDSFFQLDKDEAFNQTRWSILNTVREQDLKDLYPYLPDIDEWINNRIEYHVTMEKLPVQRH